MHRVVRVLDGCLMGFRVPQPPPAPARWPAGPDTGSVGLSVNRITCDGYGSCAELLPEMIALDEWGYPVLRPGPVPPQLLDHARMAVDTCPVLALRLVRLERATMRPGERR